MDMEKTSGKSVWLVALQGIVPLVILLVLMPFVTVVIIAGFQWHLILDVFKFWWLSFLVIIGFVYIMVVLMLKYPVKTPIVLLSATALVFLLASPEQNYVAEKMRAFIANQYDINYLLGAFTFVALALAIATIKKRSNSHQSDKSV